MSEKIILIATSNEGKVREMEKAFTGLPVRLVPLSRIREVLPSVGQIEEPVEDGATFMENARIKAYYYMEKTGLAALADDSGLSVEILDGAPGVYSARYAGVHGTTQSSSQIYGHTVRRMRLLPITAPLCWHWRTDGNSLPRERARASSAPRHAVRRGLATTRISIAQTGDRWQSSRVRKSTRSAIAARHST